METNPQPEQRSTEDLLIEQAILAAEETGQPVGDSVARCIASRWHGGQGSQLYSFQSTGFIDRVSMVDELLDNMLNPQYGEAEKHEINALAYYFVSHGDRARVTGWHQATKWDRGDAS